jgi:hypothetical protein
MGMGMRMVKIIKEWQLGDKEPHHYIRLVHNITVHKDQEILGSEPSKFMNVTFELWDVQLTTHDYIVEMSYHFGDHKEQATKLYDALVAAFKDKSTIIWSVKQKHPRTVEDVFYDQEAFGFVLMAVDIEQEDKENL